MSVAVIVLGRNIDPFLQKLEEISDEEIEVYPDIKDPEKVDVAILWNQPIGYISKFKNLRLICSFGAGVDHIMSDQGYNPGILVTRIVDEALTASMTRYVVATVSLFQYGFPYHFDHKMKKEFHRKRLHPSNLTVGILGLGTLGMASAKALAGLGYEVMGLSRHKKKLEDIRTFGEYGLESFLNQTNILVCMLPSTNETLDLIDQSVFSRMKDPAYFINVGRGQQVVEQDLLDAVKTGKLKGACLDVVKNEPLSNDNPFLSEPRIIITPHIASITNQINAAIQIADNISNLRKGKQLNNKISSKEGY